MKFFKPSDFKNEVPQHFDKLAPSEQFELMANIANAKLERDGKVVYTMADGPNDFLYADEIRFKSCSESAQKACKSKALLINIEPIENPKPTYEELAKELFVLKTKLEMKKGKNKIIDRLTCTHPKEKVRMWYGRKNNGWNVYESYECECGAKVQPAGFEEV